MSARDFQEYRRHLDGQLRGQYNNHKRRLKEIGRRWRALGTRQNKLAEIARIRAPPASNAATDGDASNTTNSVATQAAQEAAVPQDANVQDPNMPPDVNLELLPDPALFFIRCPTNLRQKQMFQPDNNVLDNRRKQEFLGGNVGLGADWIGAGGSQSGHLNTVGVWVHIDNNGTVDDRVVVKDTYLSFDQWMSTSFWSGDAKSTDRQPMEFAALKRLADHNEGSHPFVELRFNRVSVSYTLRMYRMYFAFLPHYDANTMKSMHQNMNAILPEPWLWNVFETLARAAVIMEQGNIDTPVEDWKQIVHRDIKPGNVFFGPPDETIYPAYACPKLGDFGIAFETGPEDPFNPVGYKGEGGAMGTPGFIAPENYLWVNNETKEIVDEFQILSPCNIWSIGAVMVDLMTRAQIPRHTMRYVPPGFDAYATIQYSARLRNLVTQCLDYIPSRRIRPSTLLDNILLSTGAVANNDDDEAEEDFAHGYRSDEVLPGEQPGEWDINHPLMVYRLGMTRPDVDALRNRDINEISRQVHAS